MNNDLIFSSPPQKDHGEWPTPVRVTVRNLQRDGKSQRQIASQTSLPRRTIRRILHQESSHRERKKKAPKPHLMSTREIRRCIRHIAQNWATRRLSFSQVKAQLGVQASIRTIRRELRAAGYRRCIACPRPYISRQQAKKRLGFALQHRWWGTSDFAACREDGRLGGDWRKVIWSDEATFEVGKSGRIWVTRRVDEKCCTDCIRSIYRSGRFSVMIWGAIGWDYKSPLVFLEKLPGRKGICSKAYLQQVLEPIIFPLFEDLGAEYIFMEDGAKVHAGSARLPRLEHGVRGFNWPPSSPDLNPIEKVWRWMKEELKKLPYVPKNKEDMQRELQKLWDQVDPRDFRHYTEQLT
ncbi:Transposable element Tc1 transposase, partial [Lachnellula subtilissima]